MASSHLEYRGTRAPSAPVPPCQGVCPAAGGRGPLLCEGACSNLAAWLLEHRRRTEERARDARRKGPGGGLFGLTVILALLGCSRVASSSADPAGAPAGAAAAPATRTTAAYALTLKTPTAVKKGAQSAAEIQVVPRKPYHINLEFPLKLIVAGPATARPTQLTMSAKQASKLTKSELVLRPAFTLGSPGAHAFSGTLRFSVCTDAMCEIKSETVSWTATCN